MQKSGFVFHARTLWGHYTLEKFLFYYPFLYENNSTKRKGSFYFIYKWKLGTYLVSLCGSVGKDFVYHACGHEIESYLK